MRRLDRFQNLAQSDDERRTNFPREGNWVQSSLDQISTTQHKLRATVAQNYDNILVARQENVVIAENVRAAASAYGQLSDRLSRMEGLLEMEKDSLESIVKSTKQTESNLMAKQRQLMNRGVQVERNIAKLEEEVLRLKQTSETNNKKCLTLTEKISELSQEITKQNIAIDAGMQDVRQLSHDAELNAKKKTRVAVQEIDNKIELEETQRKQEYSYVMEKIQALQTIVSDVKQHGKNGMRSYAKLVEEKDQEYKTELNNLFRKITSHINEKNQSGSFRDKNIINDLTGKVRFLEQQLATEKEARVESLEKLEDETTRHFKKVSQDIITELDKLSSSLQNTHSKDHMENVIKEMKKEIQANKQIINRVLRAEITARKSQAQKFSSSIQGVQKHSSQTVIVVQEAIQEMKTYVDREIGMKSAPPDDGTTRMIPTLEKRLSDLEVKLVQQQSNEKKSESPPSSEEDIDLKRRLSELEAKLSRKIATLEISTSPPSSAQDIDLARRLSELESKLSRKIAMLEKYPSPPSSAQDIDVARRLSELESKLSRKIAMIEKTDSPLVSEQDIDVTKRLSELESKLSRKIAKLEKSESPSSPVHDIDVTRRLSELESKLSRQIAMLELEISRKKNEEERQASAWRRRSSPKNHSNPSKDRLLHIEKNIETLLVSMNKVEMKVAKFKRITNHNLIQEKKIRNKFIEFVNSRLLRGERLKIFIKSYGVHHMKYLTNDQDDNKLLNIWGVYQAWKMHEFKRKWLKLIDREPVSIDLKEYRRIVREEKINERLIEKKAEKKRNMSCFVIDSYSDTSEESEREPEPEKENEKELRKKSKPKKETEKESDAGSDEEQEEEEAEKKKVPSPVEEGPKRINYEDHESDENYIKYKTEDEDDDDDETEGFFPETSSEEDFKLFSDEDDDDDDDESSEDNDDDEVDDDDKDDDDKDDDDKDDDDKDDDDENDGHSNDDGDDDDDDDDDANRDSDNDNSDDRDDDDDSGKDDTNDEDDETANDGNDSDEHGDSDNQNEPENNNDRNDEPENDNKNRGEGSAR